MKNDWVEAICIQIEERMRRAGREGETIICSSGISPSGPVHLGNLREAITPHLVTEELKVRGWQAEHIHVWDDFDRLRKIPAGIDASFSRYLGQPLSDIPDPFGEYDSYASRYMHQFERSLQRLGIAPRFVRQSEMYRSGFYTEKIKLALTRRGEIFDILAEYQTAIQETEEERAARRAAYYPFRVYCETCHRDSPRITAYDEATAFLAYSCPDCGHVGGYSLNGKVEGKLVWKVDWPMRWSTFPVDFEPAGVDHSTPGSSFTVGQRIIQEIYQTPPPYYVGYAFVGMEGRTKISSSSGTTATPEVALNIAEPALLRWMYARRAPNQGFSIDFGQGLLRLYEEWDGLQRQVQAGTASELNRNIYRRACQTASSEVERTPKPVSFSLLTSLLDVTHDNIEQVMRIVSQSTGDAMLSPEMLEPRLTCARNWINDYLPDDERTPIQSTFQTAAYEQMSEEQRRMLSLFSSLFDEHWNYVGLTDLMYNVPKMVRGVPLDVKPDTALKQVQRSFFVAIYQLVCGRETGPRIPTLLLSLGKEKTRMLVTPPRKEACSSL